MVTMVTIALIQKLGQMMRPRLFQYCSQQSRERQCKCSRKCSHFQFNAVIIFKNYLYIVEWMLLYYIQVLMVNLGIVCVFVSVCVSMSVSVSERKSMRAFVRESVYVWGKGEKNQCHVFLSLMSPPLRCRHFFPCTPLLLGVTCPKLPCWHWNCRHMATGTHYYILELHNIKKMSILTIHLL